MSKIEWTEKTWNPVTGCTKVSPGCENCYAEKMAHRLQKMHPQKYAQGFDVALHPECLGEPMKRKKPTIFFVCSMGDLFHDDVPKEFISDVYKVMRQCPQHTFLVLTKRPERMVEALQYTVPRSHIHHGVTVCNQDEANAKIPHLLKVPGERFLSIEPMLGPIDLDNWIYKRGYNSPNIGHIHQVILGGESGANARPLHPEWVRDVRDQCKAAGVPFMFKQWGEWCPPESFISGLSGYYKNALWFADQWMYGRDRIEEGGHSDEEPDVWRLGKKKAGRTLDGQLHDDLTWRDK